MDSPRSSSLTVCERLCAVFIPFLSIIEASILAVVDCFECRLCPMKRGYGSEDHACLVNETIFNLTEIEALFELYKKLSSSIIDDGLIQKVFDLFDEKKDGVIEFEEFVHALNVFHPCAPMEEKIDFAFRLYDLRQTGFIEREEVRKMVIAILMESDMTLPDDILEAIIDKTFVDADCDKDGRISREEWKDFVIRNPNLLKNMTLPYLKGVTPVFPSFVLNTVLED